MNQDNLDRKLIYGNAAALQMLLHSICKSPSVTDQEFSLKYDVYEKLMRSYNRWGYGSQIITFGSLTYYCLKFNGPLKKVSLGFLYVYWINHFFTIGSFIGVTLQLPWAIKQLNQANEETQLKIQLNQINNLIRKRTTESDSELNNLFYSLRAINTESLPKKTQLVENDFFDKHPEYVPQVIPEEIKLQYCDYFLTRFVYFTFIRWLKRVGQFSGVIQ